MSFDAWIVQVDHGVDAIAEKVNGQGNKGAGMS
jgi:hypothetical protein